MAKKETVKKEIVKKDELREEKMKALENALTQLNKTYGKGSVMKFSDKVADTNLQVISTGCLDLDMALGVGGLPRGRVVEIYGPESSRQDHRGPALCRRGAEGGRRGGVHRRRARAGPRIRQEAGGGHRRSL